MIRKSRGSWKSMKNHFQVLSPSLVGPEVVPRVKNRLSLKMIRKSRGSWKSTKNHFQVLSPSLVGPEVVTPSVTSKNFFRLKWSGSYGDHENRRKTTSRCCHRHWWAWKWSSGSKIEFRLKWSGSHGDHENRRESTHQVWPLHGEKYLRRLPAPDFGFFETVFEIDFKNKYSLIWNNIGCKILIFKN